MSGGKSGSSESTPWEGQAPFLTQGFEEASRLLQSGGPNPFPNATYVPFSDQTQQGLGLLESNAQQGNAITPAVQDYVTGTLNSPVTDHGAGNYAQSVLGQSPASFDQAAAQTAGQPNLLALGNLAETSSGQFLNSNPYLDGMFNEAASAVTRNFQESVAPGLASTFSNAGRTGSVAHQQAADAQQQQLGDTLSGLASNIYGQNYAQERQNQLGAANSINEQQLAASGQDISRLGLASNLYGQQIGQQQNAAGLGASLQGQQNDAQRNAAALSTVAADLGNFDANQLLTVGNAVENQAGNVLNDQINRFNHIEQQPYTNLQNYVSAINGLPAGQFGTTTTNDPSSQVGTAISGATAGFGIGGPIGALAGGVLGLFGGG